MIWIAPREVIFKITPIHDLIGTQGGDWDIERRHDFRTTAKFRSMVQRYQDGALWRDTDLFTDTYTRRLKRDGHIGGVRTLADLADQYHRRFDTMAEQMRREGFRLADDRGRPHPLPSLLIGRDGDVFIGNQGNHRLALAQVLGLRTFAGKVTCRHPLA